MFVFGDLANLHLLRLPRLRLGLWFFPSVLLYAVLSHVLPRAVLTFHFVSLLDSQLSSIYLSPCLIVLLLSVFLPLLSVFLYLFSPLCPLYFSLFFLNFSSAYSPSWCLYVLFFLPHRFLQFYSPLPLSLNPQAYAGFLFLWPGPQYSLLLSKPL